MPQAQRGVTLVSLMVGLFVSMLSIAAILSIYRNVVQQSVTMTERAVQDGQVLASLVSLQRELQGAGFGIGSPETPGALLETDFIALSGAALDGHNTLTGTPVTIPASGTATANALVWGSIPDAGGYRCQALVATQGALVLLHAVSGAACTAASQWQTTGWTPSRLTQAAALADQATTFILSRSSCWPGGAGAAVPALQVDVALQSDVAGSSAARTMLCLSNFRG